MALLNQKNIPFEGLTKYAYFFDTESLNSPEENSSGENFSENIPFQKNHSQRPKYHNRVSEKKPDRNDSEGGLLTDRKDLDLDDKGDNKTPPVQL